jgi:hypothetical protein
MMQSMAFAIPITPGKTEDWREWSREIEGPRWEEYLASRKRLGIAVERAYLQHTPHGDFNVVYLEGEDLGRSFQALATSQEPFDVWFRQSAKDLFSGLDLAESLTEPLSSLAFDGGAQAVRN